MIHACFKDAPGRSSNMYEHVDFHFRTNKFWLSFAFLFSFKGIKLNFYYLNIGFRIGGKKECSFVKRFSGKENNLNTKTRRFRKD